MAVLRTKAPQVLAVLYGIVINITCLKESWSIVSYKYRVPVEHHFNSVVVVSGEHHSAKRLHLRPVLESRNLIIRYTLQIMTTYGYINVSSRV